MRKRETNDSYKSQQRVSFISFLVELPNFIAVTISAIISGSLIVWMDFVDSLGNVLNSGFVALLSRKLSRNLKYEYNYGVGKIEAISALCCDGILICGLVLMVISSVNDFILPKEPSGLLIYVVFLKVINVAFDTFFLQAQYKIKKQSRTTIAITEFHTALKSFAFDTVALISILICWLFRGVRAVWYFSPVICIVLSVCFFIGAIQRTKTAVNILTDRTLPEQDQIIILNVLSKFNAQFENCGAVNTRKSGNTTFVDLELSFGDQTTYTEIKTLCCDIQKGIEEQIENSKVSIVISDGLL